MLEVVDPALVIGAPALVKGAPVEELTADDDVIRLRITASMEAGRGRPPPVCDDIGLVLFAAVEVEAVGAVGTARGDLWQLAARIIIRRVSSALLGWW